MQALAGRAFSRGDEVTLENVDRVTGYESRPEDAGVPHLTAFAHSGGWSLVFEFGGGHPSRTDFLERAREFLATAQGAAQAGRLGPFVDNAFSACELLAKAELLSSQPSVELVLDSGKHDAIARPYHAWAKLGNTDARFPRLLSRLLELRGPGRYLDRDLTLDADAIREILALLEAMEAHITEVVDGSRRSLKADTQNMIAKRPLRAGQLVTSDDVTIYPLKRSRPSDPGQGPRPTVNLGACRSCLAEVSRVPRG
jgi:hypothetical protein